MLILGYMRRGLTMMLLREVYVIHPQARAIFNRWAFVAESVAELGINNHQSSALLFLEHLDFLFDQGISIKMLPVHEHQIVMRISGHA